ncbi:prolyl oligopeptidase family serine peptidase [uncultured Arcticibacterium sp.]|uniref:prolyl oligopeptidase family serine peptidase n=1 Tax=uncultured Arcticibacterium sp. TaxID=2173042 RepID=UPI0030F7699B
MKTIYTSAIFLSFLGLISCSNFDIISPLTSNKKTISFEEKLTANNVQGYEVKMDQSYGENRFQKYDLYTPKIDTSISNMKSVTMVMVHGGGWSILDKSFLNSVVEEYKKKNLNLTIFNINHRLAGIDGVRFADIMHDFDLFFEHHDSLKTDLNLSDDVILWGYSSGGHLALSYAYQFSKVKIDAVAALVAPTDLTDDYIHQGIFDDKNRNLTELLIGKPYSENPDAYHEASPYYFANKNSVSTILIYGGNDNLVKKEQGEKLNAVLQSKNVKTEFLVIPEATHDLGDKMGGITDNVISFIKNVK